MIASRDQLLLPFAEREYVDVRRAAGILGLSQRAVLLLCESNTIECISYAKHKRVRIRYKALVDFCDKLRARFAIPDRRPALDNQMLRHRDRDLLPFPIDDTILVPEVTEILGYSSCNSVIQLIEEGHFEAYQLSPKSPWRISRTSLKAYLERVHSKARSPEKAQPSHASQG